MRKAYLIAGSVIAVLVMFNVPRLPWIAGREFGPVGIFRGFEDGMIGFSYMLAWALVIGGAYQLILGVLYWDMDTGYSQRWQFTLEGLGTARLLWITGAVSLLLGIPYVVWVFSVDRAPWSAGLASTLGAFLACWLVWLGMPLYDQVGIDRHDIED